MTDNAESPAAAAAAAEAAAGVAAAGVAAAEVADTVAESIDAAAAQGTDAAAYGADADGYALEGAVEALLFVSDEPVSATTLAKILERSPTEVDSVLSTLSTRFEEDERGIQLREVAGGWRLYSHPAYHDIIERYVISWDTRSLSQAALEALAVVAYHQPTTRAAVNGIRGVNSDAVISSLMEKGLVREAGRDNGPGNAILYATTRTFLEKFGLKSLKDLPPLEEFAPDAESREYIRARLSSGQGAAEAADADDDADDIRDAEGATGVGRRPYIDGAADADGTADTDGTAQTADEPDDLEFVD